MRGGGSGRDLRRTTDPLLRPAGTPATEFAAGRFPSMGHYRFYELDPADHITAGYSVECGSDAAAMRAARTLLERSVRVEIWKSNCCVAHLSAEVRHLWDQPSHG